MWIVVDGPDKCGKSTLFANLHEQISFREDADKYVFTIEPGSPSDPVCSALRPLILGDDSSDLATALMFLADRVQNEDKVVYPALRAGKTVIQDRGTMSSIVYQVLGQKNVTYSLIAAECIRSIQKRRVLPDLLIQLCTSQEVLRQRRGEPDDKFERKPPIYDSAYKGLSLQGDMFMSWRPYMAHQVLIRPSNTIHDIFDLTEYILEKVL